MRNPKFTALVKELQALHEAKSHDYAADRDPLSNFRRASAVGVAPFNGVLVRMSDKWSRIEQLTQGKTPKNESLRDSLVDLSIYAMLAILLLDEGVQDSAPFISNEQAGIETHQRGPVYETPPIDTDRPWPVGHDLPG